MHELSIAMSIIEVASEEASRLEGGITAVHLKLGPLSGVVKEALLSAYGLASEGSPLEGSRLIVELMPIIVWCPICEAERQIPSAQYMCCPVCDIPTPDVRGGRELEVTGLEVLHDDADTAGRSATTGAQTE
jgi:hydrogenase nickel incorporation protein HypA/HybF